MSAETKLFVSENTANSVINWAGEQGFLPITEVAGVELKSRVKAFKVGGGEILVVGKIADNFKGIKETWRLRCENEIVQRLQNEGIIPKPPEKKRIIDKLTGLIFPSGTTSKVQG